MSDKIIKLKQLIDNSENIVFFGGAGVSTESGVPDFRSKDGLYNQHDVRFDKYQPEYMLSHSCLLNEPEVFFEFYRQKMDTRNIEPNFAHIYLAELEKRGKLKAVVTQNIDGLHQAAGSTKVFELHGSVHRNYCTKCGEFYPLDFIMQNKLPICKKCGAIVKPDVVLYEEPLDENTINGAINAIRKSDLMIVVGTSLTVYPAASFVRYFGGETLALINKSETSFDNIANITINDDIINVINKLD